MDSKAHWERIYRDKNPTEVSWYQPRPELSLSLIEKAVPDRSAPIIDVGGGASSLVDELLRAGYQDITVLDLARSALDAARARVEAAGLPGDRVHWLEANVLDAPLPRARFAVWHDRAVFHFLTHASDRMRYVAKVRESVRPGGAVIVATFAADGPLRCSGLDVVRYDPDALHSEFGDQFRLVDSRREEHTTPSGATQAFTYCVCWMQSIAEHQAASAGVQ